MRWAVLVIAIALLALSPAQNVVQPARAHAVALPTAARALVSRTLGRDQAAYQVRGLRAHTGGLAARFGPAGVSIFAGGERLGLRLRAVGYGSALRPVRAAAPRAHRNRISYRRGLLEEWYVNGPLGLEQGFTLRAPPAEAAGPLTLALALSGTHPSLGPDRRSLTFGSLHYTGLAAVDADGRALPARLDPSHGRMLIRVDDRGARYPLTIDPVFQVAKLTSTSTHEGLGVSMAISGDTIVVGAPYADSGNATTAGAVYVFVKPAGGWANGTQTAKLTPADAWKFPGERLGSSVAISGDTIVSGAPGWGDNFYQGAAFVFVKPAGGWTNGVQTSRLTASDGAESDSLGTSIGITGGDTVVVGSPGAGNDGAAYVFVKPATGWKDLTQTAKLTPSDSGAGDLGFAIAISGDSVVAGAPQATVAGHAYQGAAYVFLKPSGGWANGTQAAKMTASDGAGDNELGYSVALSGDTAVAGAPTATVSGHQYQGAAYVFVKPAGGWADAAQTAKLSASPGAANDLLGYSAAISGDRIVAGAPTWVDAESRPGAAYVYDKPPGGWANATETSKVVAADGVAKDQFGQSVGLEGLFVAVGAPNYDPNFGYGKGGAYLFSKATISLTKDLQPTSDPGRFDLKVGSTTVRAGAGNGGSGSLDVAAGTYTVKEVGASGTALASYVSSIACTLNGTPGPAGNGTSLNVTVATGDDLKCTITNTRRVLVTLTKHLVPADDPGRFDLKATGGGVVKAAAGDGDSGSAQVAPGPITVSEAPATGTSIGDYLSSIACTRNGKSLPGTAGTTLDLTNNPGDVLACTFTNTRAQTATIKVSKTLVPSSDPGRFDLKVGPTVVKSAAGSGGSGSLQVAPGTYSVHEAASAGTTLSDYVSSIACTVNGLPGPKANSSSLNVTVATGDVLACMLTNARKARIRLSKHLLPPGDPGRFDLYVGSTLVKATAGNGDFGETQVAAGTYTVKELASPGTYLYHYASSITCFLNGGALPSGGPTSLSVTVQAGDFLDCVFTNSVAPSAVVRLHKQLLPSSDAGRFDLLVGDTVLAAAVGDGGQSDFTPFGPGTYTIKELATAGSGTNLANYASSISCMLNFAPGPSAEGPSVQVTLDPGAFLECTFKNARKAKITVKKQLVPSSDSGRFDLLVDGTVVKAAAGAGAAGSLLVAPGMHQVGEAAASGSSLSNYTSSISCTVNGVPGPTGTGTSLQLSANPADQIMCTITNQRL